MAVKRDKQVIIIDRGKRTTQNVTAAAQLMADEVLLVPDISSIR